MTATLATPPLDLILSISAFLSNPLDILSLSHVCRTAHVFTLRHILIPLPAKTCRSAFLTSQAWASYWSKSVPAAHLSRPAPWHCYSPNELRDAHIRYAATHRRWESPSPTFKRPLRLPPSRGQNVSLAFPQSWRLIRGTRWAWSFQDWSGEFGFCDLRTGLIVEKWSARGRVIDALIESRSPQEFVLFHWRTNNWDNVSEYVPVLKYMS